MAMAAAAGSDHSEMQQFSFLQDHPVLAAVAAGGDYSLNFSMSSGLAGFNRGTLQSNSSESQLHHHHLPSPIDGSNIPFFFGPASPAIAAGASENLLPPGFDMYRHSDMKGKGKG